MAGLGNGEATGAGGAAGTEGLDQKAMACFPDLEKVAVPSQIVPKAGVSIQKRMSKLDSLKSELDDITRKQNKGKPVDDKVDSLPLQPLS